MILKTIASTLSQKYHFGYIRRRSSCFSDGPGFVAITKYCSCQNFISFHSCVILNFNRFQHLIITGLTNSQSTTDLLDTNNAFKSPKERSRTDVNNDYTTQEKEMWSYVSLTTLCTISLVFQDFKN